MLTLLRVEQRSADVHGGSDGGGGPACHGAGDHVCERVVMALVIRQFLHFLVHDEVRHLKRDVHRQSRCVASIKRGNPLGTVRLYGGKRGIRFQFSIGHPVQGSRQMIHAALLIYVVLSNTQTILLLFS